jgi:CcmD family protein
MTSFQYLTLAYAFVWGALAVYLIFLNRRVQRLQDEIGELKRRERTPGAR